ncbi:hypothetical protein GMST_37850 [Geomonas silvestris]|uniref:Coiled coil domain-containing protein n=1 Tax=Geomonas silvestris TaxID=2740184 RepID=A0A6V8MN73_9BACT|nr:hypothetical protein [Geomonas silvestris]GFO61460.1 hypothetical protein GMST_37850 [Geomonas silvestris]
MKKRDEYVEKLSAQLVEWDNQIEQLQDKALSATPDSGEGYSKAIAALKTKRDQAAQKLQGISAAGEDEWEDMKEGTDRVWNEVRSNLRDAILKIK